MPRSPRGEREFITGRIHEGDIFGEFPTDAEFMARWKALADGSGYLSRKKAMDLVRESASSAAGGGGGEGGDDGSTTEFMRDLRLEVIDLLGIPSSEYEQVHVYTAVGTPLDRIHGVDAWVEYTDPHGHRVEVTLDATLNPSKLKGGYKADVMVGDMPEPESDEYLRDVSRYASSIKRLIDHRLQQWHHPFATQERRPVTRE